MYLYKVKIERCIQPAIWKFYGVRVDQDAKVDQFPVKLLIEEG